MKLRLIVTVFAGALAVAACSPPESATDTNGTWVGTITTEGNVTTVVNEAGSVWGGTARLVEEASIGVEAGPDEYMLGYVQALYSTDERIFVVDRQASLVRMYDQDGVFVGNLGQPGQGPGEYTDPVALTTDPAGRIFLLAGDQRRINVYSSSGAPLDTWPVPNRWRSLWPIFVIGDDTLWAPVVDRLVEEPFLRFGGQKVGPGGPFGEAVWVPELEYEPASFTAGGREQYAPYGPQPYWSTTAGGGIVAATSDKYRYELHRHDGSQLVVERAWEPTPIPAQRREYERRYWISSQRARGNTDFNWNGDGMPGHMPAFQHLIPGQSGEFWVYRYGSSLELPGCVENPLAGPHDEARENRCWDQVRIMDAFAADGRYLGEVELPPDLSDSFYLTFVDRDRVIARVEDEAGTIMVKRYRLVLPGEGAQ